MNVYLKSAWRALGKIYYHLLQIGNTKEFLLDDEEKENDEAKFRAKQLQNITQNLKEIAELYEYLGREVIQSGILYKMENGCYGISSGNYYQQDSMIEFYDTRYNHYDIGTVDYDGNDYYIVDYPLPMLGITVRVRGYRDDKPI